ncbi:GTP-binding protein SAR1A-like [Camellia sinensis]|uniref:GTP-binding protein SAR1A-like n=1 Tax=Camellia sinensis TaxID=4442 RepID=UPI001035AC62|nr:GTP-binding protein SAR1A-like [Camellia sinensis]
MAQEFPTLSNTTGLVRLVLRNCNMSGEIPKYIWKMMNLQMLQVDSVVYLVDAYDKERFAEAKKELDALHKKEQQYSTLLTPDALFF